jgi:hypothetical protein
MLDKSRPAKLPEGDEHRTPFVTAQDIGRPSPRPSPRGRGSRQSLRDTCSNVRASLGIRIQSRTSWRIARDRDNSCYENRSDGRSRESERY